MTIELRKFISQALIEIAGGVKDAQEPVAKMHGQIAPHDMDDSGHERAASRVRFSLNRPVQVVEFDVAVTVTDETGGKAGLGVMGGFVTIGASGTTKDSSQVVNRIKFTVPMVLPVSGEHRPEPPVSVA